MEIADMLASTSTIAKAGTVVAGIASGEITREDIAEEVASKGETVAGVVDIATSLKDKAKDKISEKVDIDRLKDRIKSVASGVGRAFANAGHKISDKVLGEERTDAIIDKAGSFKEWLKGVTAPIKDTLGIGNPDVSLADGIRNGTEIISEKIEGEDAEDLADEIEENVPEDEIEEDASDAEIEENVPKDEIEDDASEGEIEEHVLDESESIDLEDIVAEADAENEPAGTDAPAEGEGCAAEESAGKEGPEESGPEI